MPSLPFIEHHADHARVTVVGEVSGPEFNQLILEIAALSTTWHTDCLFFDLRQHATILNTIEHRDLGFKIAYHLKHFRKIASLVPPHRRSGISEQAAVRQGGNLKVFTDEPSALAWVQQGG
jgi:hypothetical protein